MSKYFCPDCVCDCENDICQYCGKPAVSLDVSADDVHANEKYNSDDLAGAHEIADDEFTDLDDEELTDEDDK
jgi:hypothetical protein